MNWELVVEKNQKNSSVELGSAVIARVAVTGIWIGGETGGA